MSAVELRQIWSRKSPAGDEWDSVEVVGFFEQAPRGVDEWIVRPVGGLESISVTADDLAQVFTLAADAPVAPEPELGIDALATWAGVS